MRQRVMIVLRLLAQQWQVYMHENPAGIDAMAGVGAIESHDTVVWEQHQLCSPRMTGLGRRWGIAPHAGATSEGFARRC